MNSFFIYIDIQPFVKQWLIKHFYHKENNFSFVKFPDGSVENLTIRHFSVKQADGTSPVTADTSNDKTVAIAIPDSKYKDPATYNSLTAAGMTAVCRCINDTFNLNLYSELQYMTQGPCKQLTAVRAWCEAHGIDIRYAETLRQRWYRMRDSHAKNGVDLTKHSKDFD